MAISSHTSVHYHDADVPVKVNKFDRCYCLKIGDMHNAELDIFVENVEQLEQLALSIQSQIQKFKGAK